MEHLELIVFGLLVGAAGLAVLARAVNVPYPIMLVLGGAGIGFVPGRARACSSTRTSCC